MLQDELMQEPRRESSIHAMLVERGLHWLEARCAFAFAGLVTMAGEIPDGWGWSPDGSILLEAKVSREDFRADAKKLFRRYPDRGMGELRYFICLPGLIKPEELPGSWGLLYVHTQAVKVEVKAKSQPANLSAERRFLCSALRRAAIRWPLKDICNMDTMPGRTGGGEKA